mmetsp:Transcript_13483/g.22567  ORF Transcript_13483/g.22567 Transcript_13483/m.22567 type:complete len:404 (-) Transcript_13483:578-1789(-)
MSAFASASSSQSSGNTPPNKEMSSEELMTLLVGCPAVKSDLNLIVISLRRRKLNGSHQCAKATLELLRNLIGRYNFSCADQMMRTVRAVGRELVQAAPSELTIGNLVRRILFLIREEYFAQVKEHGSATGTTAAASGTGSGSRRDRSHSNISVNSGDQDLVAASIAEASQQQQPPPTPALINQMSSLSLHSLTVATVNGNTSSMYASGETFTKYYPGLKAAVIAAINELNSELDNLTVVCQRAQDHVHSDECILTYGYSRLVEQFLKAAGAKRKFQLIIAESSPELDGHRLAESLANVSSISITLIPDTNIYALMARVNKVILSPQAVMADGGAICPSGQLMVCTAAKEFSVPVVCVAGAFTLTPLFAHNQSSALNQLLSPATALPYDANINVNNVEVMRALI